MHRTVWLMLLALAAPARAADELPGPAIKFPKVDGWERGEPRKYGDGAQAGYSMPYNAKGIAVTIFVYNRGLKKIPNDLTDEVVRKQFDEACAGVLEAKRLGLYKSAEEAERGDTTFGDGKAAPKALVARFKVVAKDDSKLTSRVYLTVYRDHFIKVRCTGPADRDEDAIKAIRQLLAELGKALAD
jgi:hypothetical protein